MSRQNLCIPSRVDGHLSSEILSKAIRSSSSDEDVGGGTATAGGGPSNPSCLFEEDEGEFETLRNVEKTTASVQDRKTIRLTNAALVASSIALQTKGASPTVRF